MLYIAPQLPMLFLMTSPWGRVVPFSVRIISMQVVQALLSESRIGGGRPGAWEGGLPTLALPLQC